MERFIECDGAIVNIEYIVSIEPKTINNVSKLNEKYDVYYIYYTLKNGTVIEEWYGNDREYRNKKLKELRTLFCSDKQNKKED